MSEHPKTTQGKLNAMREAARALVTAFDAQLATAKHIDALAGMAPEILRLRSLAWNHYHIGPDPMCLTGERRPAKPLRALGIDCPKCLERGI